MILNRRDEKGYTLLDPSLRQTVPRVLPLSIMYLLCSCSYLSMSPSPQFADNVIIIIVIILAALGLHCCERAFSSCGERGLLFVAVPGFSLRWLLLLRSTGYRHTGFSNCGTWAQQLWLAGSVVVAHGLSCSMACGIFLDKGSNPCPLH